MTEAGKRTADQGNGILRWMVLFLASAGFISYLPYKAVPFKKWKGGGFLGSLAGLAAVPFFPAALMAQALILAAFAAFSIWVSHYAEKWMGNHDDPRIVIDEIAGVWLACFGLPVSAGPLLLAFASFRFFDVLKGPWGRRAGNLPGGWGVVADDLLAGVLANVSVRAVLSFIA